MPRTVTITPSDNQVVNAFGRLRVSNEYTIMANKQIHDNLPLFWDDQEVSGSGTASFHNPNRSETTISVSATTAGTRVRQTKRHFNGLPGKSQLILMSGILGVSTPGITRRIGAFDENNGFFFEDDGVSIKVVVRSSTSGSPVDTAIARSDWVINQLDDSGDSRVILDFNKLQNFIIDYECGSGRVRFGFFINGLILYIHEVDHVNTEDVVYLSTPNLPLRYEISNDGTGPSASVKHICATVISEGGRQNDGSLRYASTGISSINANVSGTIYTICALRLKTTALDSTIKPVLISLNEVNVAPPGSNFEWLLIMNPVVANAVTFNGIDNTSVEFAVGNAGNSSNSTLTGGTVLAGGYINANVDFVNQDLFNETLLLGSLIDGTRDELYLAVRPSANNMAMVGGIQWRDIV